MLTHYLYHLDSELAGPQQDIQRARGGGKRDSAAQAQVLLFGPERRLTGPCSAKPALCSGKPFKHMHMADTHTQTYRDTRAHMKTSSLALLGYETS